MGHALPSQVFRALGLTHITKAGHTRGTTKGDPDPTFPAGLTDVVPYDADHLLLARGTEAGLASFRKRVAAADVTVQTWKVHVEFCRAATPEVAFAAQDAAAFPSDTPTIVTAGTDTDAHSVQLSVHASLNGTLTISLQRGLPPPAEPTTAPTGQNVFVPTLVWSPAVTQPVAPGSVIIFDDKVTDYIIRVTVTANPPPILPAKSNTSLPAPV